jgi:hypothetical protein
MRKYARRNIVDRFLDMVSPEPTSGCWFWTGAETLAGYGTFVDESLPTTLAHRVSYLLFKDKITKETHLHHVCHTRCCVNPDHLVTVLQKDHKSDHHRPSHCKYGHEFTVENTYRNRYNRRGCRECHKLYERRRYRRLNALTPDRYLKP